MVRIAIVDNAPVCQTILTGLCRRYEAEQGRALNVTVFDDGDAFVASYTPVWDVIIIDVDLGGIDGLGVMRRIREVDDAVEVILVSLTDEYAVGGYEINAMSYILKPPSYEVFAHDMTRCLDGRRACERRTIQVISGGRTRRVRLDEIIYVDSVKHRTILHTMLGNMQIVCSIIRFEERLIELDHAFVRANSGYLVNLAHVTAVAEHEAIMSNGDRLPISRPRRLVRECRPSVLTRRRAVVRLRPSMPARFRGATPGLRPGVGAEFVHRMTERCVCSASTP